ncbi:hypothetical protein DV515_00013691 [Chloebia gouldiae]|uniref:Uncharacterized protein n=1 Tax=Chloebia gouldiae TaxID=44316 RepID=A0A3L8S1E9_CHLGU|nr:hypothetical protein DV515_00013691 [Chloebia gouldiae]
MLQHSSAPHPGLGSEVPSPFTNSDFTNPHQVSGLRFPHHSQTQVLQSLTRVSGLRFLMMGFSLTDRWCWYPLKISRWFTESPTRWMLAPITKVMMLT